MKTPRQPIIRQGMRIPYMKPGTIMGPAKGNLLIAVANAILNMLVKTGSQNKILISERNAILAISTNLEPTAAGSTVTAYRVKSLPDGLDYFTAAPLDSSGSEGTTVNVALPWKLRESLTSSIIYGTTWDYTYATVSSIRIRTATESGGVAIDEVISPPYFTAATQLNGTGSRVGDIVFVSTVDYTGVTVSGTPLTLIDINADGRAWATKLA